jgi:Flp pilus assembly protein protease CpaA
MPMATTVLLGVVAVVAAGWDWQTRRLPNWLTIGATGLGVALSALPGGVSVSGALLGGLVGLAVGMTAFATGILGAGDGKYLMALGTFFGPVQLLYAMLAMAVAGGVLAIVESARQGTLWVAILRAGAGLKHLLTLGRFGQLPERSTVAQGYIPYGVAMSAGALFWWFMGGRA